MFTKRFRRNVHCPRVVHNECRLIDNNNKNKYLKKKNPVTDLRYLYVYDVSDT